MTRQERNEKALKSLHPQFSVRLRLLIERAQVMRDMELLIVQARRSFADQQRIYLSGVRAAPPGHSFHELGLAADLLDVRGGIEPGRYDSADWEATNYDWIADQAETLGMVAGHRWERKDSPHLEYHPGGWGPRSAHLVAKLADDNGRLPDDFFEHPPTGGTIA